MASVITKGKGIPVLTLVLATPLKVLLAEREAVVVKVAEAATILLVPCASVTVPTANVLA